MPKLPAPARYLFACLLMILGILINAYWILGPTEWRPELLRLMSRSFALFTAGDPSGWLTSHVYSSVFLTVVTLVLIGIVRGASAMRLHWVQSSSIACLAVLVQIMLFYGSGYLRTIVRTVYEHNKLQVSRNEMLAKEIVNLGQEINVWKATALKAQVSHSTQATEVHDSAKRLSRDARTLAGEILDYQSERMTNAPVRIMMAIPGGPEQMRRNEADIIHYNDEAVMDFLKSFGGRIESITRKARSNGADISRLNLHILSLNSIQMMRLIGDDLNDVAGQLDKGNLLTSKSAAAEKGGCPSFYRSCP